MTAGALNISITRKVTGYPPRRPLLVIEGPPAAGAVDNPAPLAYFAKSVTAISRSS